MDSGGTCAAGPLADSFKECYRRSKSSLGTTTVYPRRKNFTGSGLLEDGADNPFVSWTRVFMIYCDGTEYQGSLDDPVHEQDRQLYFRGMDNVAEAFEYLNQVVRLYGASKVLLTGTSAGAVGTFFWANHLHDRLRHPAGLSAVPDSGVFLGDFPNPYTNSTVVLERVTPLFTLVMKDRGLSIPECNKDLATMMGCFNTVSLIPLLKGRWMLVESPYDQWSIQNILTINCTSSHVPGSLDGCSEAERGHIERYRTATLAALQTFKNSGFSLWSPACVQHTFEDNSISFNSPNYRVPDGRGARLAEALRLFTEGVRGVWEDSGPWPINPGCSRLKQ